MSPSELRAKQEAEAEAEAESVIQSVLRDETVQDLLQRIKLDKASGNPQGKAQAALMRRTQRLTGLTFPPIMLPEWLLLPEVRLEFSADDIARFASVLPLTLYPAHLTHWATPDISDADPRALPSLMAFALMSLEANLPLRMNAPCAWRVGEQRTDHRSGQNLIDIITRNGRTSQKTGRTATVTGDWALTVEGGYKPATVSTLGEMRHAQVWVSCKMGHFHGSSLILPIHQVRRYLPNKNEKGSLDDATPEARKHAQRLCVQAIIPAIKAWGVRCCADADGYPQGFFGGGGPIEDTPDSLPADEFVTPPPPTKEPLCEVPKEAHRD